MKEAKTTGHKNRKGKFRKGSKGITNENRDRMKNVKTGK
jgi:hypothetical protein